jgi:hypothetical protein
MTDRAGTGFARREPTNDAYAAVCVWKALFQVK